MAITSARKGQNVVPVKFIGERMIRTDLPKRYPSVNAAKRANGKNQTCYTQLPPTEEELTAAEQA